MDYVLPLVVFMKEHRRLRDSYTRTLRENRGGRVLGCNFRQEIKGSHQVQQHLTKTVLMFLPLA